MIGSQATIVGRQMLRISHRSAATCVSSTEGRSLGWVCSVMLLFRQYQIQRPATENVRSRPAKVSEDGLVGAAALFQRASENRHKVERTLFENAPSKRHHRRRQPSRIDRHRPKRIAEDIADKVCEDHLLMRYSCGAPSAKPAAIHCFAGAQ